MPVSPSLRLLEPVVAEGEEEAGVEAGIQMAEAGVGMMDELNFKIPGAARAREEMEAERALRGEIHIGGVSGRDVVGGENNAAGDESVGRDALMAGEIPFENDGLEAAAVNRAARLEESVDRHEVGSKFEIAAEEIVEVLGRHNAADAGASDEELSV